MRTAAAAALTFLFITLGSTLAFGQDKIQSLCQFHYPSDYLYEWHCVQLTWKDTPRKLFGKNWIDGLRFNRMDRRHFIAGMAIKVPRRMSEIKDFSPMPPYYDPARLEPRYILIDQNEMFMGAYEYGILVFSSPVAVGSEGYRLKNGFYQVDAVDARHESSLYLMEGTDRPYPMHYALRFHIDKRPDGWSTYWLHGRDLPGYPASHGCIGLYDEEMQKEYYNEPQRPLLTDARRLYEWVVQDLPDDPPGWGGPGGPGGSLGSVGSGGSGGASALRMLPFGPRVEIMGEPPAANPELGLGSGTSSIPVSTPKRARP